MTIALLLGAFATSVAAVRLSPEGTLAPFLAPSAVFTVAAVVWSSGRRLLIVVPAVFVVSTGANLASGWPTDISVGFGLASTAEALVAAAFLTAMWRQRPALNKQEDVLQLLGASVGGALAFGVVGGVVASGLGAADLVETVRNGSATHATALVTLLGVALVLDEAWPRASRELLAQGALFVALTGLVFGPQSAVAIAIPPLVALTWAAARLGVRVLTAELAVFSIAVMSLTSQGRGPFGDAGTGSASELLSAAGAAGAYLLSATVILLPLAVSTLQSQQLLSRVRADEELFHRNFTESLVGMAFLTLDEVPESDEDDEPGLDVRLIDLNETAAQILGAEREDLIGTSALECIDLPDDFAVAIEEVLAGTRDFWRGECDLVGARRGRTSMSVSMLASAGPEPILVAQILDITDVHEAQRSLGIAERLTSTTLDTTASIIIVTDLDGTVVRVNEATREITGYSPGELVGRPLWGLGLAPSDTSDIEALLMWPNRSGVPVAREADALTRSGEKLRIVWNTNIVRDENDKPAYAVMTGIDVTAERATTGLVNHLMEASHTTALVGVDTRGRITVVNSGTEHLLGYDRHELVGQPFVSLFNATELLERTGVETVDDAFAILVDSLGVGAHAVGETKARDWTWLASSGMNRLVSLTVSVAKDDFTAHTGYLCVARDVSEQRHSQEMLITALDKERTAVERLRVLDAAKNDFVSTVSHELRTPVTSIVGYIESLLDGDVVQPLPEQLPILETVERNGRRLITMVNDLLMLSELDSSESPGGYEPIDLGELVRPTEDATLQMLKGRDLVLSIEPPSKPVFVVGDRSKLERVLTNLLSNAIKFTEDGGQVEVLITEQDGEAVIKVSDTGIGIPADEQAELFQRFFRASTAQRKQIQGTGLGLSIVSAIVQGHGGRLDVQSAHLQGSTFAVYLPLAKSERLTHSA
jgi:PAS domain S-box-containing protein